MISKQVLVLGAIGMLGIPVVRCLVERGHKVRIMVRNLDNARLMFGNAVEIIPGSALNRNNIQEAMADCDAVHISLPSESELTAMQYVVELLPKNKLKRITYVSATTACEENRWFELADVKMRTEEILQHSGIAYSIFCPTWAMETLCNFIHEDRASVIIGKNPPALHFFAAVDFGRMVAASFEDDRVLGKRLFVHGPQAITLPDALERFINACYPELKTIRLKLWQAQLIAKLTGREGLTSVTRLIAYFDQVGEMGDPTEANELLGAPSITLEEWIKMPKDGRKGSPH